MLEIDLPESLPWPRPGCTRYDYDISQKLKDHCNKLDVRVDVSTIEGAGMGLFNGRRKAKGTVLNYTGECLLDSDGHRASNWFYSTLDDLGALSFSQEMPETLIDAITVHRLSLEASLSTEGDKPCELYCFSRSVKLLPAESLEQLVSELEWLDGQVVDLFISGYIKELRKEYQAYDQDDDHDEDDDDIEDNYCVLNSAQYYGIDPYIPATPENPNPRKYRFDQDDFKLQQDNKSNNRDISKLTLSKVKAGRFIWVICMKPEDHFVVALLHGSEKEITIIDSMEDHKEVPQTVCDNVRQWYVDMLLCSLNTEEVTPTRDELMKGWKYNLAQDTPRQPDKVQCGVYASYAVCAVLHSGVLSTLQNRSRDDYVESSSFVAYFRCYMLYIIIKLFLREGIEYIENVHENRYVGTKYALENSPNDEILIRGSADCPASYINENKDKGNANICILDSDEFHLPVAIITLSKDVDSDAEFFINDYGEENFWKYTTSKTKRRYPKRAKNSAAANTSVAQALDGSVTVAQVGADEVAGSTGAAMEEELVEIEGDPSDGIEVIEEASSAAMEIDGSAGINGGAAADNAATTTTAASAGADALLLLSPTDPNNTGLTAATASDLPTATPPAPATAASIGKPSGRGRKRNRSVVLSQSSDV